MISMRTVALVGAALLALGAVVIALPLTLARDAVTENRMMMEKALKYESAWALYQALKKEAGGGQRLEWSKLPDWSGLYIRDRRGFYAQPEVGLPAPKLTPKYEAEFMQRLSDAERGIEFDPIADCSVAPGHPRWLGMPFLREHIVTPDQTTMIAEAFNSVRRIYTDGRDHMPEGERYALHTGDSIGFWDEDKLLIHTNQLMAHYYERDRPQYSEQVETVEIWQKVDDVTLEADVWIYDPPVLAEPWYTKHSYTKVDNSDKTIRVGHYECRGNPNSEVHKTEDGGTDFVGLEFTDEDD